MQTALLPFISNHIYPNNYSIVDEIIKPISNINYTLTIPCDSLIFDAIIIPTNINLISILSFQIIIGNITVFDIPFDILKINKRNIENKYYIPINDNIFGKINTIINNKFLIPFMKLYYQQVFIKLNSNENFNYEILVQKIYYQTYFRKKQLENLTLDYNIYQYQTFPINNCSNQINAKFPVMGIYIKTFDEIINFELILNNKIFKNISKNFIIYKNYLINKELLWTNKHSTLLKYKLKKIPIDIINIMEKYININEYEYLYYFPIDDYGDTTINFSVLDNISINIQTFNNKYDGYIYAKNKNILRFQQGGCSVLLS